MASRRAYPSLRTPTLGAVWQARLPARAPRARATSPRTCAAVPCPTRTATDTLRRSVEATIATTRTRTASRGTPRSAMRTTRTATARPSAPATLMETGTPTPRAATERRAPATVTTRERARTRAHSRPRLDAAAARAVVVEPIASRDVGTQGVLATPDITLENPSNQAGGRFGGSVARIGDVDGDGHADLAVGAWGQNVDQPDDGAVFVYHGGPEGTPTTPNAAWTARAMSLAPTTATVFAPAGDVNGDGYADLIVGAYSEYDPTAMVSMAGAAFVYHGGPPTLSPTRRVRIHEPDGQHGAAFGFSVTSADMNGDGYADVVVGTPNRSAGAPYEGNAFVSMAERPARPTLRASRSTTPRIRPRAASAS